MLRNPHLLRLDIGIFVLHMVLTALFVVVPVALVGNAGLAVGAHWKVYVPVLALSLVGMVPLVLLSARRRLARPLFAVAVTILLASQLLLAWGYGSLGGLLLGLWVFFVGFNTLEAMLPSAVSRLAPPATKGTALGVYNSFEFAGVFAGGACGGLLHGLFGLQAVFVFCAVLAVLWLVIVLIRPPGRLFESVEVPLAATNERPLGEVVERLEALPGVVDVTLLPAEGVAYLRVDPDRFTRELLAGITGESGLLQDSSREGDPS